MIRSSKICENLLDSKLLTVTCFLFIAASLLLEIPTFLLLVLLIPLGKKASELKSRLIIHFMKYHPEEFNRVSIKIGMGDRHFPFDFYLGNHFFRPTTIQQMLKEIKRLHRLMLLLIVLFFASSIVIALLTF